MNAIGISELWLIIISLLGAPPVGITLPNQPAPDPEADAARFQTVTNQLDSGGVVHAYVSVDGDLTAIAGYANSLLTELRKMESGVPEVNVPALLRVTGLDAVSAMGFSSVRTEDGFRNKIYIHNGLQADAVRCKLSNSFGGHILTAQLYTHTHIRCAAYGKWSGSQVLWTLSQSA